MSVIVPCYRVAESIPRLVAALASQDSQAELLFVEDGSRDETADVLQAHTGDLPNARVLVHASNRGRAAARNTGIAAAAGDVLLFLDADMEPRSDVVRVHAETHQQPGVVGVVSTPRLEGLAPEDPYHQYLRRRHEATVQGSGPVPYRHFIVGYTSVRSDAVRAVEGFDERFTYGEDIDFAYRLAQRYPEGLVRAERAVVYHHAHGNLDERLGKLAEFGRANLPLLLSKHPDLAATANLDFVRPGTRPTSWLRWAALQAAPLSVVRRIVPRIPEPLRYVGLRYLMAATIANAYRVGKPD